MSPIRQGGGPIKPPRGLKPRLRRAVRDVALRRVDHAREGAIGGMDARDLGERRQRLEPFEREARPQPPPLRVAAQDLSSERRDAIEFATEQELSRIIGKMTGLEWARPGM